MTTRDPGKRSRKPSAASPRPPDPVRYFADACLGQRAVRAMREGGMDVIAHDDVFPQGTSDVEWLTRAGTEGWVVLSKDKAILRRGVEYDALARAKVRKFVLVDGSLTAEQIATAYLEARPQMALRLQRTPAPFVLSVSGSGNVGRMKKARKGRTVAVAVSEGLRSL